MGDTPAIAASLFKADVGTARLNDAYKNYNISELLLETISLSLISCLPGPLVSSK